jgi:hypothetical protein
VLKLTKNNKSATSRDARKISGVGETSFRQMTQPFLDHPYNRIKSPNEKIIAY